jgi:hypothetical protein
MNLDELQALYERWQSSADQDVTRNSDRFATALVNAFPAMRAELVELREALREVIRHAEFDPDCRENELASIHRGQLLTVIDVARAALEPRK